MLFSLPCYISRRSSCSLLPLLPITCRQLTWRNGTLSPWVQLLQRPVHTDASQSNVVPFRKRLKDNARLGRVSGKKLPLTSNGIEQAALDKWRLAVGIEVHAQLNTERKLFSYASSQASEEPNTRNTYFDLALPGSQPIFQKATLLPALRAALALNCRIQHRSQFDRKHYFYQDQPAGYQITQYYQPFAKDGFVTLYDHDGIAPEDGNFIQVGIKQIQMEQDTAKTTLQPPDISLLDFNRVGHPLIEIITLPQIHHPQTAAACVRKIQSILQSVNAVTTGMEMGGLRADVNVSITPAAAMKEIKNLSSFKAVEDAIIAERNRQINVIDSGGTIDGETRGWTLGSTETTRLRGKEGEVDYRYLPDPDIAPLIISEDLIGHLSATMPFTPDQSLQELIKDYSLSANTAQVLILADDGLRLDYFHAAASELMKTGLDRQTDKAVYQTLVNWTIHEIGALLTRSETHFSEWPINPSSFALLIKILHSGRVTGPSAKTLLHKMFDRDSRLLESIIKEDGLELKKLPQEYYISMAANLVETQSDVVKKIRSGQLGKLQWLVGQMVRMGEGKVEAKRAEDALKHCIGLNRSTKAS